MLARFIVRAVAMPTGEEPDRRRLLSWSTTYCYPDLDALTIGCAAKVPTAAPDCAVGWYPTEESPVCALGSSTFGAEEGQGASYQLDYCPERVVYELVDKSQFWYCARLQSTGDWSTRARPSTELDSAYAGSWFPKTACWIDPLWSWIDGSCKSNTRYLGERCWDGGECQNEGVSQYDGLHLSCAALGTTEPTCVPSAKLLDVERERCTCGWFDWYIGFACGAENGGCNGHACVLTTQDMQYYCDYQTDNNW